MNFWRFLPFLLFLIFLSICISNGEPNYKFPTSETHRWFKECALKRRITQEKGAFELQTLFAHAKMEKTSALFFDFQYNGYVADQSLLKECNDDKAASKADAEQLIEAKCVEGNNLIKFTTDGNKRFRIGEGCNGFADKGKQYVPKYNLYSCHWEICKGNKYILVERPSQYDLRKIYYIDEKEMNMLKCLPKVCKVKPMEEVHLTNLKETAQKTKRHKLFVECAVERKNDHIETLFKNIPLDDNQILFFGKSANIYVGHRSEEGMKEACEKDKEAKMILPISYARLKLENDKLMFNYTIEGEKMENGKKIKSAKGTRKYKSEVLNVQVKTGREKHCAVMTQFGAYNVLFCPSQICGKHKLILLRIKKTNNKAKKRLMDIDRDRVNVDHIYVVKMKEVEADVIKFLKRKCPGKFTIVEGVSRKAHSSSAANGIHAHSNGESKKDKNHKKNVHEDNTKNNAKKNKEHGKKGHENPKSDENDNEKEKHQIEANNGNKKSGCRAGRCPENNKNKNEQNEQQINGGKGGKKEGKNSQNGNGQKKKHPRIKAENNETPAQKRAGRKAKKEAREKEDEVISPADLFNDEKNEAKKHENPTNHHKKEQSTGKSSSHVSHQDMSEAAKPKINSDNVGTKYSKAKSNEVKQHEKKNDHKKEQSTGKSSSNEIFSSAEDSFEQEKPKTKPNGKHAEDMKHSKTKSGEVKQHENKKELKRTQSTVGKSSPLLTPEEKKAAKNGPAWKDTNALPNHLKHLL